ncbi:MAG: glycosyltransferase family 39 protein [Planctomycetota bacterium]|nr:glycosyltransferase family 39 protein [Planctomycetota bacterium]
MNLVVKAEHASDPRNGDCQKHGVVRAAVRCWRAGTAFPRGQIAALVGAWLVGKLCYASARQLVPDEACYWVWSRHLDWSYFDHPPMVAYLIRIGTAICGETELGVRAMAVVSCAVVVLILAYAARRLVSDPRLVLLTVLILLLAPPLMVAGTIMTPDTPTILFQTAALACALTILRRPADNPCRSLWLWGGVMLGLALVSKYTAVLTAVAIFGTMLTCPQGRQHLRRPWPWLAVLVALLIFAPVIYWNYLHEWPSFRFQLQRGGWESDWLRRVRLVFEYLGGQVASFAGVLSAVGVVCMVAAGRRYRQLPPVDRLLLWASCTPLVFFFAAAFKNRVEMNWPSFAYLPLTLLIVSTHERTRRATLTKWTRRGLIVAACCSVLIHVPEVFHPFTDRPLPTDRLFGWRESAAQFHARMQQFANGQATLLTNGHQDAAVLNFYLPGQPTVWSMNYGSTRPNAYNFWEGRPDLSELSAVVYVGQPVEQLTARFDDVRTEEWPTIVAGRMLRSWEVVFASQPKPGARQASRHVLQNRPSHAAVTLGPHLPPTD